MRGLALAVCCAPSLGAQQSVRQRWNDVQARRDVLRAEAKQAYDAEMARQKAGDCLTAATTYDFNICFAKEVSLTDQNLKAYDGAIRDLLGLKYPGSQSPPPDAAGNVLTPEQEVAEFDHREHLWRSYMDAAARAAFHQFDGGTGAPSFEMETHLRLVRSHMAQLNDIYGMLLRL